MHEWALLIFTICTQAAIGGVVMLAIFYKKIAQLGEEQAFKAMKLPLLVIAGLSIAGLAASFAHLGTPTNAFNTILGIGHSWMSREILLTGMFIGVVVLTAGLALLQKKVNFILLIGAAVIGLIDIYCMAMLYADTLVSGWSSVNTFTSFYGTALVLGPVLVASFLVPFLKNTHSELTQIIVKNAFYISLIGMGIQIIGVAVFGSAIPEVNMVGGTSALASLESYQTTVALRWIIGAIGVAFLGYLSLAKSGKLSLSFAYVALAVLFLAEGMNRYVFYVLGA